jgi:hypothetical protein
MLFGDTGRMMFNKIPPSVVNGWKQNDESHGIDRSPDLYRFRKIGIAMNKM